jgi:hypothetical protein
VVPAGAAAPRGGGCCTRCRLATATAGPTPTSITLLIGPPGLVSINTKHHRTGKLYLDGDQLLVNGYPTDYVPKARREAQRVTSFLQATLTTHGHSELAGRAPVRSPLAIVGGRLMTGHWPAGVTVVMTSTLIQAIRPFPAVLDPDQVAAVYELARRSTMWNPTPPSAAGQVRAPRSTIRSARPRTPRPEHPDPPRPARPNDE